MRLLLISFLAVSALWGTGDPPQVLPQIPAPWIQMSRRGCYGPCPIYRLTVQKDGSVVFFGEDYTAALGTWSSSLPQEQVDALRRTIKASVFWSLAQGCCDKVDRTDAPTTILRIIEGASMKTIVHYHGCDAAPPALADLEARIVELTGAEHWIEFQDSQPKIQFGHGFEAWLQVLDAVIGFDGNEPGVRAADEPALQRIAEFLGKYPSSRIKVLGCAPDQGPSETPGTRGLQVAGQVKAWLVGKGVNPERVAVASEQEAPPGPGALTPQPGRRCRFLCEFPVPPPKKGEPVHEQVKPMQTSPEELLWMERQQLLKEAEVLKGVIHFDRGSSRIRKVDVPVLTKIAEFLRKQWELRIRIEGHSDQQLAYERSLKIAQGYANSAVACLIRRGVRRDQLVVLSYGKERPRMNPAAGKDAAKMNRRCEFMLME